MSERIKAYVYIRVKADNPTWIIDDDVHKSGTIAVGVPGFSDVWKARADDRYAQEFALEKATINQLRKQIEVESLKSQPNTAFIEDWQEELNAMETARDMLLEQDYQWEAEIIPHEAVARLNDNLLDSATIAELADPHNGIRVLEMVPGNIGTEEHPWEGSFRILEAQKSGKEQVLEAIADGKQVFCAIPMAIGTRGLLLNAEGEFGGAFEITMDGVKGYEQAAAYHLFATLRATLEKHADTDALKGIMGI